jgi:protein-S-isoprenylcysteine O-methyltransferase Ste14
VALADVLICAGLLWSNWALRSLGRNISVIAQARGLATSGPYRLVRHPLYLGELVAMLGLVVRFPSAASVAAWVLTLVLQLYRTRHEEAVLVSVHPQYADYRARTSRIVPGMI